MDVYSKLVMISDIKIEDLYTVGENRKWVCSDCGRTYFNFVRYCNDCGRRVDAKPDHQYKKELVEYCKTNDIDIEDALENTYFDNSIGFFSKNALQSYERNGNLYVGIVVCESESHRGSSSGEAPALSMDDLVQREKTLSDFLIQIGFEKHDIKMYLITWISV